MKMKASGLSETLVPIYKIYTSHPKKCLIYPRCQNIKKKKKRGKATPVTGREGP
jgi:hypothetical protein